MIKKNSVTYWRSSHYNLVRLLITIFVGFVFGTLYWDQGLDRY